MIKPTEQSSPVTAHPLDPLNLHHVTVSFFSHTNTRCAHSAPPHVRQGETTEHLTRVLLTCCGLQKQQGEETADRDCTLHDGCQENSDSHTGYIYQGGKVKGHTERRGGAQRGPAGRGSESCGFEVFQESVHATGTAPCTSS